MVACLLQEFSKKSNQEASLVFLQKGMKNHDFVDGSFHIKSPRISKVPMADTSDFIETYAIGCLHEQNAILKISASFFIWFKNYYTSNFAKNKPKLPSVSCKQDFSNFGLK